MTETISASEYQKLLKKQRMESPQQKAFRHIMRSHFGIIEEYKFHPDRKYRFDYAIPELMLAFEYEGIHGKSRHTTMKGYTGDCNKYNLAGLLGWRIFRYTALNYKQAWTDIETLRPKQTETGLLSIIPHQNNPIHHPFRKLA